MPLSPGQVLNNRYRVVKLLGQGGFGAVYRAWDLNIATPCAVKENLDVSPVAKRQFEREAIVLANLQHPNLPRVRDHFLIEDQGQYLVMDYIEGNDLGVVLADCAGQVSEAEALNWIGQVCDALDYLHSQNPAIIHRDIKPANIKVTPNGQVMLVDFGIAKVYDPHMRTTIGARAVTPGFSPPEQYGLGTTDACSDVYALGATLYALLTCQEPVESIQRTLGTTLPSPKTFNPAISPITETAILKAMALMPGDRYGSAQAFKAALARSRNQSQSLHKVRGHVVNQAAAGMAANVPNNSAPQSVSVQSVDLPAKKKPGQLPAMLIGIGALVVAVACIVVMGMLLRGIASGGVSNLNRTQTALALRQTQDDPRPASNDSLASPQVAEDTTTPVRPTSPPAPAEPLPNSQTIWLRPSCGKTLSAEAGENIEIRYGLWAANGQSLIRDTSPAISAKLTINGSRFAGSKQSDYLSMSRIPCGSTLDNAYWMYYIAEIGTLSPGSYSIRVDFSFSREITDGYDMNNDDKNDVYGPSSKVYQTYELVVR